MLRTYTTCNQIFYTFFFFFGSERLAYREVYHILVTLIYGMAVRTIYDDYVL